MNENKKRVLAAALRQIKRQLDKGAVMRMGDHEHQTVPAIFTDSLGLDIALGIDSLPRDRIVEIYDLESSSKATSILSMIAKTQKQGTTCILVDAGHAFNLGYAGKPGVSVDDLLISQPNTGEQALEITDMLVRSNAVGVIIVDSTVALVPRAEIEGEAGDVHVSLQARLMPQALHKITGNIKNTNYLVIFINQTRMEIGVMFNSPETTAGGNALRFYTSAYLNIRRTGVVKEDDEAMDGEVRIKVVKDKASPPPRRTELQILYGEGIYRTGEAIDLSVQLDLVKKPGTWYSYQGSKVSQSRTSTTKCLGSSPGIDSVLEKTIHDRLLTKSGPVKADAEGVADTETD